MWNLKSKISEQNLTNKMHRQQRTNRWLLEGRRVGEMSEIGDEEL